MKALSLLIALFSSQAALAANCLGEAQIIAVVEETRMINPVNCVAIVKASSVQFYSESQICPLSLTEVLEKGIEVGVRRDDYCSVEPGDTLSGVVVKGQMGHLVLEN